MKVQIKFFFLGFLTACLMGLGGVGCFIYLLSGDIVPVFHDQVVPSGKTFKIVACNFVWGSEHSDRNANKDCFALEYVSPTPNSDPSGREREVGEIFELIRPVSELWKLDKAEIHAFVSTNRKDGYDVYFFTRNSDGKWTLNQHPTKIRQNE